MPTSIDGYRATLCGAIVGRNGRFLKQALKKSGYLCFGKVKGKSVKGEWPPQVLSHRFIYEFFKGPIPDGYDVDHIDGDRANNKINNLQVLTRKENVRKALSKITNEEREFIRHSIERGVDLAEKYNISQQTVCDIRKGRK